MIESNNISGYNNFIKKSKMRTTMYKLEFLRRKDESPIFSFEGDIIDASGSITNSLNDGVRRTCSLTLSNVYNKYSYFFDKLSMGSKFKLYIGYVVDGEPLYFSYGIYILDNPVLVSGIADKTISISGSDKWSMMNGTNGGVLQWTYEVFNGSILGNVIQGTLWLEIVSDPKEPSIYSRDVPAGSYYFPVEDIYKAIIPYEIVREAGGNISDIILEVVFSLNAYCYYNEDGRLIVKEFEYDATKTAVHNFIYGDSTFEGNDINYISSQRTYDYSSLYNAVTVIGDNMQNSDSTIVATAYNNDASDPNSVTSIGYVKAKVVTEYTKGINTQQLADERARYELKKASSRQSIVNLTCLPLYHLDVNNIVTITDKYINADNERFLINSIVTSIGSDGAQMSLELIKARDYL